MDTAQTLQYHTKLWGAVLSSVKARAAKHDEEGNLRKRKITELTTEKWRSTAEGVVARSSGCTVTSTTTRSMCRCMRALMVTSTEMYVSIFIHKESINEP